MTDLQKCNGMGLVNLKKNIYNELQRFLCVLLSGCNLLFVCMLFSLWECYFSLGFVGVLRFCVFRKNLKLGG